MGISERCIGEGMNIYYKEKYKGYPYPVGVFVYTAYPNTLLNKWYGEPNELQEYTEGLRVWSEGELTEAGFKHVRPKWFDDKQVYYEIELIEYFYRYVMKKKMSKVEDYYDEYIIPMLRWMMNHGGGVINIHEAYNLEAMVRYKLLGHRIGIKNVHHIAGKAIEEKGVDLKILDMFNKEVWVSMKDTCVYPFIQD